MSRIRESIATMPPGAFAFVMATGIVSVGLQQQGIAAASYALLAIGAVAWVVLVVGLVLRCVLDRDRVLTDLHHPKRAFGFFTLIAGTDVLAVRVATEQPQVSVVLLALATVVGLLLGYAVPWAVFLSRREGSVLGEANGTWFVWVVASQSIATAAATLEPTMTVGRSGLAALAVIAWAVGVALYGACAVFVALRLMLHPLSPKDLDPPYWVSMGAMAITIVAGSKIVQMSPTPIVEATSELIAGLAVLFWAWATWLIPVLFAVGIWRHGVHRVPFRYETSWWSIVFPLGMYAVAGMYLGRVDNLPVVEQIGSVWLWLAVAAWLFAGVQMVRSWISAGRVRSGHGDPRPGAPSLDP